MSLVLVLGVALVSSLAAAALALGLGRRRRRPGRSAPLAPLAGPRAPGVSHLAARVSELSDVGIHLHAARRGMEKPRLGALLGLR